MEDELEYIMLPLDVDCSCDCCDDDNVKDEDYDILPVECDCDCECHPDDKPEEPTLPNTKFSDMYDFFLAGITDDMFMELTKEDTEAMLEEILLAALPHFEFPHKDIFNMDMVKKEFLCNLNLEEKMIIRQYMIAEWIGFQLASIENIRQKYSGSDFKFTSQASHIDKLVKLRAHYIERGFHLQRVYCRRRKAETVPGYVSTMGFIMEKPRR